MTMSLTELEPLIRTRHILWSVDAIYFFVDGVVDRDVRGMHELPQQSLSVGRLLGVNMITAHSPRKNGNPAASCKKGRHNFVLESRKVDIFLLSKLTNVPNTHAQIWL